MTGAQRSCESTFGLTEPKEVSCTGSVETLSGSPPLSVIEIGAVVYQEPAAGADEDTEEVEVRSFPLPLRIRPDERRTSVTRRLRR